VSLFFFTITRVLLPFLCLPLGTAVAVFLISECTCSLWFSLQFAVSHEVEECVEQEKSLLNAFNNNENTGAATQGGLVDWGAHQVLSSHNYGMDSLLSLHLSGGLNLQIEHHLFPSIHYVHYPGKLVESCFLLITFLLTPSHSSFQYSETNLQGVQPPICLISIDDGSCEQALPTAQENGIR